MTPLGAVVCTPQRYCIRKNRAGLHFCRLVPIMEGHRFAHGLGLGGSRRSRRWPIPNASFLPHPSPIAPPAPCRLAACRLPLGLGRAWLGMGGHRLGPKRSPHHPGALRPVGAIPAQTGQSGHAQPLRQQRQKNQLGALSIAAHQPCSGSRHRFDQRQAWRAHHQP